MGRLKRIILLTVLFLCAFSTIFIYRFTSDYFNFDQVISDNASFTSKYNDHLSNCGWLANWAPNDGFQSLKDNSNILDCVSPVLYDMKSDGSLSNISPSNLNDIITYSKAHNIKIYPTITLFDYKLFSKVLESDENLARHIDAVVNVASNPNYDGIDLDYESTQLSDKDKYRSMIIDLSDRLHAIGKKLIVTVLSKWGDNITYNSLPETRQVQDWRFLGNYADFIRIMAYDYTYSRATYPGPIAPLTWVESVIRYAKTQIPDEKIILGVHLYSYQWSTPADTLVDAKTMPFIFMYDYTNNIENQNGSTQSYDYGVVEKIISQNTGYGFSYQGEQVYVYQKAIENGKYENRVLVYIDQQGVLSLKKLAARYNLAGVSYWRLGNEKDLIQQ